MKLSMVNLFSTSVQIRTVLTKLLYGHKLTPEEISNGTYAGGITVQQANALLDADIDKALAAGTRQAQELGLTGNLDAIYVFTQMSYQLGTAWDSDFTEGVAALKSGDVRTARSEFLDASKAEWINQTPNRGSIRELGQLFDRMERASGSFNMVAVEDTARSASATPLVITRTSALTPS